MSIIEQHHRERIRLALAPLSLGETQLLLLGLWVIGEENRVDPRMQAEYGWLLNALNAQARGTLAALIGATPPIAGVATDEQIQRERHE